MNFSIAANPQVSADLVTFTEEIGNGKLHFCAAFLMMILIDIFLNWHSNSESSAMNKNTRSSRFIACDILNNFATFLPLFVLHDKETFIH